ncbi:MAG: acyl-CoA dehydrogenase family protein [Cyclobacteriaceae bacterium]|nr:acyl-CoA dehydrogenase family protein [Cyclobacteriaceae bacterium]
MTDKKAIKGGEFLIRETEAHEIFIPEDFTEEQRMIAQTCHDFLETEVYPHLDEIDSMKNPDIMPGLMDKAGELGLLGTSVPEALGGFGMDFNTTMLVSEVIGGGHSFAVALSAHTGIGTLPILYYGNEEQKQKYIPKLASGEYKSAYCLTEPDSGSDANSGKTKAVLSADGKEYLITGQKMWITNGGFADIFIVFAKIEDDKNLTAFIIEKGFGGITMNEEEKKMGIKGSSTRQIFFNDCKVPVENMLSDRGNGFKIAVNILNIGRIKLGVAAVGASKMICKKATEYANERKQFNTLISSFGAIKHKLANMAIRTFVSESAHYRASQNIDDAYHAFVQEGVAPGEARLKSLYEFSIECAILKVHGSEVLDYCADEGVQIYGGMGFSAEGPMDRAYRDARINRIFEGTNEINRMLCIDMLLKRAMKGEIDLMGPAMEVQKELMSIPDFGASEDDRLFAKEKKALINLKKAGLMVSGAAVQKYMEKLSGEQEVLMNLADMLIEGYAAESAVLRVEKMVASKGEEACAVEIDMMKIYLNEATEKCVSAAKEAIYAISEGDTQRMMLMGLKRFTKVEPFNIKDARRRVADHMIKENKYPF